MVTADSDRYVKVDISIAKTAIHIRELVLNKVCALQVDNSQNIIDSCSA